MLAASAAATTVESVQVEGAQPWRAESLRVRTGVEPGPLNEALIEGGRLALLSTGYFQRCEARLERGSRRGQVALIYACEARPTGSIDAIHLGHARPTRLWGGLEVSDLDPLGLGVAVSAGAVTSGEQSAGRVGFAFADLIGDLDLGLSLRYIDGNEPFVGPRGQRLGQSDVPQVFLPYTRAGGSLDARFHLGPLLLRGGLGAEYVQAEVPADARQIDADEQARPFDFDIEDGGSQLTTLRTSIEHDTRDDPAYPVRGIRAWLEARAGFHEEAFGALLLGYEHYLSLPFRHVLRVDAKAGGMIGEPPFFERFFIGDVHPYVPERALGLNFARRRGPNLIDGTLPEQRYETVAGRLGLEYRLPLSSPHEAYRTELFVGAALISLGSPDDIVGSDLKDRDPLPFDLAVDAGLRIESEIGVVGVSVGNLFLLVDP